MTINPYPGERYYDSSPGPTGSTDTSTSAVPYSSLLEGFRRRNWPFRLQNHILTFTVNTGRGDVLLSCTWFPTQRKLSAACYQYLAGNGGNCLQNQQHSATGQAKRNIANSAITAAATQAKGAVANSSTFDQSSATTCWPADGDALPTMRLLTRRKISLSVDCSSWPQQVASLIEDVLPQANSIMIRRPAQRNH